MKPHMKVRRTRKTESGYALLIIMFFLALLVLSMSQAAPTILSSIQREKETEMVWRGKQYTRGVRLYYLKLNRFPTSLDDLTKPKTGIRFMRQAYKDPMNQVDGSWRLIYVGPNGQLIGSLSDRTIGLGGMGQQGTGGLQGGSSSLFGTSGIGSSGGISTSGSSSFGSNQNQAAGSTQGGAVGTAMANGANSTTSGQNQSGDNPNSFDDPLTPHSLGGPMDASNTIGGNIIGVGSKVNKKSFLIYEKAKNYRQFEFIWDPSKDMTAGRASVGIGNPVNGNSNGISPAGGTNPNTPFGMNPSQIPGNSTNPNPSQNQNPNNPGTNPDSNQIPPLQAPPNQ